MKIGPAISTFVPYRLEKPTRAKKAETEQNEVSPNMSTLSTPETQYLARIMGQNVSLGDFLESIKQDLSDANQSNPTLSARY
ncbi:hypothetical protein K1X76_06890 [bacterium]|nr:hypothetical protein [bacterium]